MKRIRVDPPDGAPPPKVRALEPQVGPVQAESLLDAADAALRFAWNGFRNELWQGEERTLDALLIIIRSGHLVAIPQTNDDMEVAEALGGRLMAHVKDMAAVETFACTLQHSGARLARDRKPFYTYFSYTIDKGRLFPAEFCTNPTEAYYDNVECVLF